VNLAIGRNLLLVEPAIEAIAAAEVLAEKNASLRR
jgi:hypothetical protein